MSHLPFRRIIHSASLLDRQQHEDTAVTSAKRGPSAAQRWCDPVVVVLLLTAGVLALDALLPGLPGARTGLIGRLMALMSGICPQRPSHSYTLGGIQLPIEARMMGIFGGFALGMIELATIGRRRMHRWPRLLVLVVLALGLGLMAFDGFNALFFDLGLPHAYAPDLRLRLATGILAGIALAFFLMPCLAQVDRAVEDANTHAAPGWTDVEWVLLGSSVFAWFVASGWGAALVPMSLIGAGGVVLAWMVVNRIFLWLVTGACPAGFTQAKRQWLLGVLAAGLAVGELVLLAWLRGLLLPQ